jgi:hypothetical protein
MGTEYGAARRDKFALALGTAFLLQFATSLAGGLLGGNGPAAADRGLEGALAYAAGHASAQRWSALLDTATAVGVIWLAAMLYALLRTTSRAAAVTALLLRVVEAALLVASRAAGMVLVNAAQADSMDGAAARALAQGAIWFKETAYAGSMVFFGAGAVIFYALLVKSKTLPIWLPAWGLAAVLPILAGGATVSAWGFDLPLALQIPYVPVEVVMGAFILWKGLRGDRPGNRASRDWR